MCQSLSQSPCLSFNSETYKLLETGESGERLSENTLDSA